MRWLLDQGLPRSTSSILTQSQEDVLHIGCIGMARATDPEIIRHALSEDRIVVTLDADFHALLAVSGSSKPSVTRIREDGLKGPQIADLILRISRQFNAELDQGCVLIFQRGNIRYRMLPL